MKHLIDILDLSVEEIDGLCTLAEDIIKNPSLYSEACKGKILGTLFFEPSTRTRLSFTSAMMSLGGNVLGFSETGSSSVSKGESLADTVRMVSSYSDIIAMRHSLEGAPIAASAVSGVPIINAGDGSHFHPTQTLTDLLTIKVKKGRFDNLTIGVCGDLKYGRTVHSLISAMTRYRNVKFVLISPKELAAPKYIIEDYLLKTGTDYTETAELDASIPSLDILYMTRIQRERFDDIDEYERLKNSYMLTAEKLKNAKPDLSILHPLPRVNEISTDVDSDARAQYFEQAAYGRYIRMALILKLLKSSEGAKKRGIMTLPTPSERLDGATQSEKNLCQNKKCITQTERGIKYLSKNGKCIYCDGMVR